MGLEDLIFSIRHDRAKVNRLRIYLSWKDLRKKAKEQEGTEEGPEVETMEEPASGTYTSPRTFPGEFGGNAIACWD